MSPLWFDTELHRKPVEIAQRLRDADSSSLHCYDASECWLNTMKTSQVFHCGAEEHRVGVIEVTADKGAGDHFGNIVCQCWSYMAERPNELETWFGNVRNVGVEDEILPSTTPRILMLSDSATGVPAILMCWGLKLFLNAWKLQVVLHLFCRGWVKERSSKTQYVIRPGTSPARREQCLDWDGRWRHRAVYCPHTAFSWGHEQRQCERWAIYKEREQVADLADWMRTNWFLGERYSCETSRGRSRKYRSWS